MTYRMITVNGTAITAPDMHGETGEPFIPFSVRGPLFLQLRDGTLLYFFGIKYTSQADEAMGCQALMRSHDGGKTWGEMRRLTYDGVGNIPGGTPVYDAEHDRLLLLARSRHWKPGMEEDHLLNEEDQILGKTYERFWQAESLDGGLTWSDYREKQIEGIPATWRVQSCPTPGAGIQLYRQSDPSRNGRLVYPFYHAEMIDGQNEFRIHLLLSDDYGETWRVGAHEPFLGTNEAILVEMQDGTLLYNSRNQGGFPENLRIQGISTDGGETLTDTRTVDTLYDPICHAGFASAVVEGRELLFLSAPAGELGERRPVFGTPLRWGEREKLTLYGSSDGGKTYKALHTLTEKGVFTAYSALFADAAGQLHCAWETGPSLWNYRDIAYTTFSLHDLAALL